MLSLDFGANLTINPAISHDLSIPVAAGTGPSAFYLPHARVEPVKSGSWTGDVTCGASVNCMVCMLGVPPFYRADDTVSHVMCRS